MIIKNSLIKALLLLPFFSLFTLATTDINDTYEKALISFQNDEFAKTVILLKNILKENSSHMPSRVLMAQVLINQGNGIAAQVALDQAKAGNVDEDRLVTLYGQAYILQGKYDKALDIAEIGNRGSQIEAELLLIRGQAYIGKKAYTLADKAFSKALELNPKSQLALLGRAQITLQEGNIDKALSLIELSLANLRPFANGWILKSKILHKLGKTQDALVAIEQAIKINNEHLAAHLTKAMLHLELEEYQKAVPHVDLILENIPNEPRATYLKAIINAGLPSKDNSEGDSANKKLTEVITTLSVVPAEVMDNNPDYYFLAGLTNFNYGNLNDAHRYLTSYLKYAEFDIDTVRMIASIDLQQGELSAAQHILKETNLVYPNNPDILTLLGLTYLQLDNNEKAQFYFEQVVTSYPNSPIGLSNLALSKMQSGEYNEAINVLADIKDNKINGMKVKLLLADSYQNTKNYASAIEVITELGNEFPTDSFFPQRLGMLYGLNNQLDKARASFEQSLILDNENILAMIHLARMDNIAGDFDKALKYLQSKLEVFNNNTLLMSEISDSYLLKKDMESALVWIKKAYAQNPNNLHIVLKLSRILRQQNKLDEAVDLLDQFIDHNSRAPEALLTIAQLFQQQKKHQQAILALIDYVDKTRNKPKALILLAKAQIEAKDHSAAIQSFTKAIVEDDEYLPAYIGLVNLTIKNKDEKFSLNLIKTIEKITKSTSLTSVLKGDLYLSLEKTKQSIKFYKQALQASDQKQAILGLYHSYKLQQQASKAIVPLENWLKKHPDDMLVAISLADSYSSSKQLQKSADYYHILIKKYGLLPIFLNNLASIEFSLGNTEKAKDYAQQAYNLLPDNVAIIDTLAWIKSRMGEHSEAIALFRIGLTKDFDHAEIKYHIAITLDALSRRVEARKYLIEAVESDQNFPEKEEASALLKTWI